MAEVYTVKSYAKGVDIAPRKVSVVASLVRNRTVADAFGLRFNSVNFSHYFLPPCLHC
jgi:ribosomal protein L22